MQLILVELWILDRWKWPANKGAVQREAIWPASHAGWKWAANERLIGWWKWAANEGAVLPSVQLVLIEVEVAGE